MFWILMMTNGNVITRTYCTMRFAQRLPNPHPASCNLANGFQLYVGRDDNDVYLLPMGKIAIDPTEKGWELIRNWPEDNSPEVDNKATSSLDDALRRP